MLLLHQEVSYLKLASLKLRRLTHVTGFGPPLPSREKDRHGLLLHVSQVGTGDGKSPALGVPSSPLSPWTKVCTPAAPQSSLQTNFYAEESNLKLGA